MHKWLRWLLPVVLVASLCLSPMAYSTITKLSSEKSTTNVTVMIESILHPYDDTDFRKATSDEDLTELRIVINSPGGKVFGAFGIVNQIKNLKARGVKIITESSSLVGSASAIIWLMGDERIAHDGDLFMFHKAAYYNAFGGKSACIDVGSYGCWILDEQNNRIRQLLLDAVRDVEIVNNMLDEDQNWYTVDDMLKLGLVDFIE